MNQASLFDYINKLPDKQILWSDDENHFIVYDYLDVIERNSLILDSLSGKKIALGELSSLNTAILLALLDGRASLILLLPIEQEQSVQIEYLAQCEIDYLITDQPIDAKNGFPVKILVFKNTNIDGGPLEDLNTSITYNITRWIIPTSGTTGKPKLIAHTLQSLTRSMANKYVGDRYVWAMLYGIRRFAGLQVYLQSIRSETNLVFLELGHSARSLVEALARHGCNALSATPTMWRKLAMTPGFECLLFVQITLGGEIADAVILTLLRNCFPHARITHIYASTEAGFGFAVQDGLEGFPVKFLNSPPPGVAIRVSPDNHLLLRSESQDQVIVGAAEHLTDSEGWIDTGDLVERVNDRFLFRGRVSGSINVGGNKVMPEEVEKVILSVEGVSFAVVKGKKNPVMGQLVEAYIQNREGYDFEQLKAQVLDYCRKTLAPYKVPFFIKRLDTLEVSAVGKLLR